MAADYVKRATVGEQEAEVARLRHQIVKRLTVPHPTVNITPWFDMLRDADADLAEMRRNA